MVEIRQRGPPEPVYNLVYNLEVQVDHIYHVGDSGTLVHNAVVCPGFSGLTIVPRKDMALTTYKAPDGVPVPVWGQASSSSTTKGYAETILRKAREMAESGQYDYVLMQRSWRTATRRVGKSGNIPDIIGVRRDGKVDAFEVESRTDVTSKPKARLEEGRNSLPAKYRGIIKVIKAS